MASRVAMLVTDDRASRAYYQNILRSSFTAVKVADTMENVFEQLANSVQAVLVTVGNDHLDSRNVFAVLRGSTFDVPFYFLDKVNTKNLEQWALETERIYELDLPNGAPTYIQYDTAEEMRDLIKSVMKPHFAAITKMALLVTDNENCEEFYSQVLQPRVCKVENVNTIEEAESKRKLYNAKVLIMTIGHARVDPILLFKKLRMVNPKAPFIVVDKVGTPPPDQMLNLFHQDLKTIIASLPQSHPNGPSHIPFLGKDDFAKKIWEKMG